MFRPFKRQRDERRPAAGASHPRPGARASRAERFEMMLGATSHGVGECPLWMLLMLEKRERAQAGRAKAGNVN